tara:strand:- start:753 stop:881 length:129 start_codon:yes stop_codon:yes gene_type:complete
MANFLRYLEFMLVPEVSLGVLSVGMDFLLKSFVLGWEVAIVV